MFLWLGGASVVGMSSTRCHYRGRPPFRIELIEEVQFSLEKYEMDKEIELFVDYAIPSAQTLHSTGWRHKN